MARCCRHHLPVLAQSQTLTSRRRAFHSSPAPRFASQQSTASSADGTIEFNLADIGEGIAECELIRWFVKTGDPIAQFDKVCEVQSDKANVEITSRFDGIIKQLHYKPGDLAKVGASLMTIQLEGVSISSVAKNDGVGEKDFSAAIPSPIHNDSSAKLLSDTTPPSTDSQFTDVISAIDESDSHESVELSFTKVQTSPAVRRIAKEERVDLTRVKGTGPQGRILKDDVFKFLQQKQRGDVAPQPAPQQAAQPSQPSSAPSAAAHRPGYLESDVTVQVSGLQRIMVQTMTAANAIPHFMFSDEIVVDQLHALRSELKTSLEKTHGVKLTFLPFLIKAMSLALRSYPQLNAHTNSDCSAVIHRASHNIGLAMDTPKGLLVPNIKNVQSKSIVEIAREINRLQSLGKEGKLGRDDLTGGTITLSNVGVIGGTVMAPVLVMPELVIGALGAIRTLPRFDANGAVVPTRVMGVSFSGDHRVVDGATMARFVQSWKGFIEKPQTMIAEMA